MRRLFVFSRKPDDDVLKNHRFLNYWHEYTHELYTDYSDVYTTNMYALYGAQDSFDEIYLDYVQVWPNEKANFTNKELRIGHNLCKILGAYSKYYYSDTYWDDIIDCYGKESDFIKNENHKNDNDGMTIFDLYKNLESLIERGQGNAKVIAYFNTKEGEKLEDPKSYEVCYKYGETELKSSNKDDD